VSFRKLKYLDTLNPGKGRVSRVFRGRKEELESSVVPPCGTKEGEGESKYKRRNDDFEEKRLTVRHKKFFGRKKRPSLANILSS
jgi:hypothetical protein